MTDAIASPTWVVPAGRGLSTQTREQAFAAGHHGEWAFDIVRRLLRWLCCPAGLRLPRSLVQPGSRRKREERLRLGQRRLDGRSEHGAAVASAARWLTSTRHSSRAW